MFKSATRPTRRANPQRTLLRKPTTTSTSTRPTLAKLVTTTPLALFSQHSKDQQHQGKGQSNHNNQHHQQQQGKGGNKSGKLDPRLEKQRQREEAKRQQLLAAQQVGGSNIAKGGDNSTQQQQQQREQEGDQSGDSKKEKAQRTWLLIHADMQYRTITGPLEKKAQNNADRRKNRQDQMRDLLVGKELIQKLVPALTDTTTKVWHRKFGEKEAPQLMSFQEAIDFAQNDGEWSQVCMLRSSTQNPRPPPNIKHVTDDGLFPVWTMNVRNVLEELYDKDTQQVKGNGTKEIHLNTTITPDDLQRKVQHAIDFLFEGNTVRLTCNSKSVAKLQTWVEANTYFNSSEIQQQTSEAIAAGKTLELNIKGVKTFQRDVVEKRIKETTPQNPGETDAEYKARINGLVEIEKGNFDRRQAEQQNQQKQQQQLVEARISQNVDRLLSDQKKFNQFLTENKTKAQQLQREAVRDKAHPDHRTAKALKPNQYLQPFDKIIALLIKQIDNIDTELGSWREKLLKAKKGQAVQLRVFPYQRLVGMDGIELTPHQIKLAQRAAQAAQGDGMMVGGKTAPQKGGKRSVGVGGGGGGGDGDGDFGGDEGEEGDDEFGHNDDGGEGLGEDDEDKPSSRPTGKLSKREMDEKKTRMALEKMTAKERVQYLAGVMSKQTYGVIGDVVDVIAKVSTIMQMERVERKKNKTTLEHEDMDPAQYAKLSNKDKKRHDARMAAVRADPNAGLKLEIQNAMELFHKGTYVYNDAVLEQQTKKPFWCTHDGGATAQEASRKNSLTLNILRSVLNDGKSDGKM